mmetsp:Transcript_52834/g.146716  ORF Transcript_52834/g.146716 Transcript_52834/m.146716 type:complete len:136 (+) Transcript_52834:121-528(+)
MLSRLLTTACRAPTTTSTCTNGIRQFSSIPIPVTRVASVLQLKVSGEEQAVQLDGHMKVMTKMMEEHPGFEKAIRNVCKSEWAYELQFVFTAEGFGEWGTSSTRDKVHAEYLSALDACGIQEDEVYGGARVHDEW